MCLCLFYTKNFKLLYFNKKKHTFLIRVLRHYRSTAHAKAIDEIHTFHTTSKHYIISRSVSVNNIIISQ